MESLLKTLQGFGLGRAAALAGAAAGVAAILIAVMLRVGGAPKSLLYSNVDLKEAGQITQALDAGGIKYELKGDGSTILVDRDKVAATRLMLSSKGLPTSGSVGYEIFDNAPALGQTDFVQSLNRQRALEGELARTIKEIQGVNFARVHLVMPKRQLFEQDEVTTSAAIMIGVGGRALAAEQIRAIRNLVAGAVPNLKPDRVSIMDQSGEPLAGSGEGSDGIAGGPAQAQRSQAEEKIRKTVMDIVQGVVGPGKARVQVTADLDLSRVTTQEEKFDPDGQVVRSTQTGDEKSSETKPGQLGAVSSSQNIPGATPNSGANENSNTGKQEETTNYEISKTTRTEVSEPGRVKKLSVAVAVDGLTAPAKGGKPGAYTPRNAEEMKRIEELVRAAVGFDQARGDQVKVTNVQFEHAGADDAGVSAASPFSFDKNDVMRSAELGVLLIVAGLIIFFVARPMLATATGPGGAAALANVLTGGGGDLALAGAGGAGGQLALPEPGGMSDRLDIARIEGQVQESSIKQVQDFVERNPEASISLLRQWLHEG